MNCIVGLIVVFVLLGGFAFAVTLPLPLAWALAAILGLPSLLLIVGNPIAGFIARRHKKNYSFVPFLGGILGILSLLFCPVHAVRYFAWIPLILDFTFPMFFYAVFIMGAFRADASRNDKV